LFSTASGFALTVGVLLARHDLARRLFPTPPSCGFLVNGAAWDTGARRASLCFGFSWAATWAVQAWQGAAFPVNRFGQVRRRQLTASRAPSVPSCEVRNLTTQCTGPGLAAARLPSKRSCSGALRNKCPGPVTAGVRPVTGT